VVYLVGAGPGDPGLMTVKALDVLRRADVVLYDRLIDLSLLSETKPGCRLIDVGKRPGKHAKTQDETTELLVEYGGQGLDVVRLKGGDPYLFGRGGEEAERLGGEGIPFAVVPGVTALTAATAYAGIPVTHRDFASSVGVATGHGARGKTGDPVKWRELARGVDTVVVFMGIGSVGAITTGLMEGGLPPGTPAAVIENGTSASQRTVTGTLASIVDDIEREGVKPPALLVVGKTVTLADRLSWFEPGPLAGLRIGVTRPLHQSRSFIERLASLGARPIPMPTIRTEDTIDTAGVKRAVEGLPGYDYVVFSSTNGVDSFFRALKMYGGDARRLAGTTLTCIGPVTADALERHGVSADIVAERFIAEGLSDAIFDRGAVRGKRFLLVRSNLGRDTLRNALEGDGATIDEAVFYETLPETLSDAALALLEDGAVDIVTFTSSSTVHNFFTQFDVDRTGGRLKLASIGPQTSGAIRGYGAEPDVEASVYTTEGLADAIMEAFGRK